MEIKNVNKQKGFTLVEIAIVLVIIGLLLGGVLKGQELITNTKYKSVKADADNMITAIYAYQDRFRTLPGDDSNADTNLNPAGVAGNGDGEIDGNFYSETDSQESRKVFDHLRKAGFITGAGYAQSISAFGGIIGVTSDIAGTRGVAVCQTGMNIEDMTIIDNKYDDGIANTGSMIGVSDTSVLAPGPNYIEDRETALCIIY